MGQLVSNPWSALVRSGEKIHPSEKSVSKSVESLGKSAPRSLVTILSGSVPGSRHPLISSGLAIEPGAQAGLRIEIASVSVPKLYLSRSYA